MFNLKRLIPTHNVLAGKQERSGGCVKFLHAICQNRGLRGGRGGRGGRGRGFLCISSLLSQVGVDFSKPP